MTSEEESPYEYTMAATLEFEVDSIILMYHRRLKGERIRAIEILKMRGTDHSEKTLMVEITKQGIKIDPSKLTQALIRTNSP
jgi:KaiC/GvpD/RAD55 family RecA-like ATPase